ncbi:MAG: sulfite exporter TauE/SafE family protein [Stackebrandtia sp.]
MTLYLLTFALFAVAASAQAVSGFGFALVAIPAMTIMTNPETALVAVGIVGLPLTAGMLAVERTHVSWRPVWQLVIPAFVGMPVGLAVLLVTPEPVMTGVIALIVVGCTVLVWRRWRLRGGSGRVYAAGAFSGVLSTMTGTNGPVLVAVLQAKNLSPRTFRASMAAIFAVNGVVTLVGFSLAGVVSVQTLLLAAVGLPAIAAGSWIGNRLFHRIDAARFRQILLGGLVATSVATLAHAGAGVW